MQAIAACYSTTICGGRSASPLSDALASTFRRALAFWVRFYNSHRSSYVLPVGGVCQR